MSGGFNILSDGNIDHEFVCSTRQDILLKIADKTAVSVRFPSSLKKQITIRISGLSLEETLSRLLKGINYALVYSGSRKKRAFNKKLFCSF